MADKIKEINKNLKNEIRRLEKRIKWLKWYNPLFWMFSYHNEKQILQGYIKTYKELIRLSVKIMVNRKNNNKEK